MNISDSKITLSAVADFLDLLDIEALEAVKLGIWAYADPKLLVLIDSAIADKLATARQMSAEPV